MSASLARLTLLLATLLGSVSASAQSWTSSTDLQPGRSLLTATTAGGKAFFAGGGNVATVNIYDSFTGTWSLSALSLARSQLASTSVGDLALFAGGLANFQASDVVDIYDVATSSWSEATLSEGRYELAATSVAGYALFAGGAPGAFGPGQQSDRVDIYDSTAGLPTDPAAWSQTSLSVARTQLAATTVGPYALFGGGRDYGSPGVYYDVVDVYDSTVGPPTDPAAWSQAKLSVGRIGLAATTAGSRAFFAGGHNFDADPLLNFVATVDIYDSCLGPPSDPSAWSVEHLSAARTQLSATSQGDTALFAGGSRILPTTIYSHVDVFDGATGQWSLEQLSEARTQLAATTVGSRALFAGGSLGIGALSDRVDIRQVTKGTLFVDAAAPGPGTGAIDDPFVSIQDAVQAAQPGDTVSLAPGSYPQPSTLIIDRDLLLIGACGADVTTLNGQGPPKGSVVQVNTGATVELRGLTLANGHASSGGGLHVQQSAIVTVIDSIVRDNRADFSGGGIDSRGSLTVLSSRIADNQILGISAIPGVTYQGQGGGISSVFASSLLVRDCEIVRNSVVSIVGGLLSGGGVSSFNGRAENTLFSGNYLNQGVTQWGHAALGLDLVNCTLVDNRTPSGFTAGSAAQSCVLQNCIVWYSDGFGGLLSSATFSLGVGAGIGNIDADPRFVDPLGPDGLPATGDEDYRLRKGSPAIDAADNGALGGVSFDLAGRPRFRNDLDTADTGVGPEPVIDMGAYEFQPRPRFKATPMKGQTWP